MSDKLQFVVGVEDVEQVESLSDIFFVERLWSGYNPVLDKKSGDFSRTLVKRFRLLRLLLPHLLMRRLAGNGDTAGETIFGGSWMGVG